MEKGDFIEIDFVARVKGSNKIFDLTRADIAKKEGIFDEKRKYKPLVVCLGAGHLLKGLDMELTKAEVGKEIEVEVKPEDAFGRRNPKLIQLTTLKQFKDKGITPVPGLQLSIDGALATIRSVSGGRVIIDFNHPLAGRILHYQVKVNKKITDAKEKVSGIIDLLIGDSDYSVKISEKEVNIEFDKDIQKQTQEVITKQITELIPELKGKEIKIQTKKP